MDTSMEAQAEGGGTRPDYGMDCVVCGVSVETTPGDVDMPAGWGFVLRSEILPDGKPGLGAFYACPECKDESV
jgi:hypothetical protein